MLGFLESHNNGLLFILSAGGNDYSAKVNVVSRFKTSFLHGSGQKPVVFTGQNVKSLCVKLFSFIGFCIPFPSHVTLIIFIFLLATKLHYTLVINPHKQQYEFQLARCISSSFLFVLN